MKAKYKSRYTDRLVTVAQYLAELVCERQAKKEKTDLFFHFWQHPRWKRTFLYQVQLANGLLKLYAEEAILTALKKNPGIYSLNANFLDPLIQAEQEKCVIAQEKEQPHQPLPEVNVNKPPRPKYDNQTPLHKLRDL
jgi:hypothetical protein